jgi:hypothetical protein
MKVEKDNKTGVDAAYIVLLEVRYMVLRGTQGERYLHLDGR